MAGSSSASLHAKTFVFDRETLFVGSPNFDPRSGRLNTEMGILFRSTPLAEGVADWFDDNQASVAYRLTLDRSTCAAPPCAGRLRWTDRQDDREVVYVADPETGVLQRLVIGILSVLPIEGQL